MAVLKSEVRPAPARRFARLFVPRATLCTAWEFLRAEGLRGCEQLCFLAGRAVDDGGAWSAQVTSCVLPQTRVSPNYVTLTSHAQTATILDGLEARSEQPLVTLHTHADGGREDFGPEHSSIDDLGVALTPEEGLWSGVVPWYALGSSRDFVRVTAFYEFCGGKWLPIRLHDRRRRILVQDDVLRIVPAVARLR
jgi:hypothetical protein